MIILHTMRADVSIVCLCVMFAMGVAQLNVVKRDYFTTKDGQILQNSTTLIQQKAQSLSACVSLCSIHKACCVVSYNRKTQQCNLDKSCCPESEQSADAQMWKIRTESHPCPNGWLKYENKCYYFSDELKNWTDAKIACEDDRGMLVEVDSKCENDFLKVSTSGLDEYDATTINMESRVKEDITAFYLPNKPITADINTKAKDFFTEKHNTYEVIHEKNYWLGGTDEQKVNVWIWSHSQNVITFTDWDNGQPNNALGNQSCLEMWRSNAAWNDETCELLKQFICEKDLLN